MKNPETLYEFEETVEEPVFELKLFVTGATPNSARAIANLTSICEEHLHERYDLEIIDVYQQPSKAKSEQIIALPMLLKDGSGAPLRIIACVTK